MGMRLSRESKESGRNGRRQRAQREEEQKEGAYRLLDLYRDWCLSVLQLRFGCRKDISAQAISDITLSSAIIGHSKKARRTKNITTDREEIKPLI